jgi:hypothetical protein
MLKQAVLDMGPSDERHYNSIFPVCVRHRVILLFCPTLLLDTRLICKIRLVLTPKLGYGRCTSRQIMTRRRRVLARVPFTDSGPFGPRPALNLGNTRYIYLIYGRGPAVVQKLPYEP